MDSIKENHEECIHETDFKKLRNEMNKGYESITELKEDNILIKAELGIKNKENGERDKQIAEALTKINKIGKKAEEEDKNIKELVIDTREMVIELKGYLEGSKEIKKDKRSWHQQIISVSFAQVLGFIFSIIILFIIAYTCL